jgi:hypothetical protein
LRAFLLREANIDVEKLCEMPKDGAVDRGGGSAVEERLVAHQHRQGFQVLQEKKNGGEITWTKRHQTMNVVFTGV